MKLTVLTNLFPNPAEPTRGIFNFQQLTRLTEHVELSVLTPISWHHYWRDTLVRNTQQWKNIKVRYFPYYYPPGFARSTHGMCLLASLIGQQRKYFRSANCDAIYACWGYPDAFAAACLAKHYQRPLVVKCHGSDVNIIPKHRLRRKQMLWGFKQAKYIVVVSDALKQRLIELGVTAEKIRVIYNGVDNSIFYPDPSLTQTEKKIQRLILFVGRLTPEKGALDLLTAFLPLAKADPTVDLHYIGLGASATSILQQAAQAELINRIHISPPVPHAELNRWYNRADVVCLPSYNEGVPNVLLEAMACGTPVVATNVGGIPEIVTPQTGLLVAKAQPQELRESLSQSLSMSWDKTTIQSHSKRFNWPSNIQTLLSLIR